MAPPPKMLKKVHFFCDELDQKNIYEKAKIQFVAKKVYFFSIFRGGAIKHEIIFIFNKKKVNVDLGFNTIAPQQVA